MASKRSPVRVGLLVLSALAALAVGVFLIGDQNRLFASKNDYYFTSANVAGLNEGNPVRLNGVTVGLVQDIELPQQADVSELRVEISIERRYSDRIREDSQARIRTLGLLGDKYVDVTSGSPEAPKIPPGGRISTEAATNVDKLIASGEDVMDNLVAISHSFRNILTRVDRGEGFVGELTTEQGEELSDKLRDALDSIDRVATSIDEGEGPLGRLLHDEAMGDRIAGSLARLESILDKAEHGPGLLPAMLDDEDLKEEARGTLADLREAAASVRSFSTEIQEGDGLATKLLTDEAYAEKVSRELESLIENLNEVSTKLNRGEGTAARLINDPQIYDAAQDIVVGVDESRLLRWLIRNRQKKGIEVRYEETMQDDESIDESADESADDSDDAGDSPPDSSPDSPP